MVSTQQIGHAVTARAAAGKAKNVGKKAASRSESKKAPPPKLPEQRNIILSRFSTSRTDFVKAPLDLSTVWPAVQGTLTYTNGDRAAETTGPERLIAILGPGATIRGVAEVITPLLNRQNPTPLTEKTVTDALLAYNSWTLTTAGRAIWKVGVGLPLPIEVTPGQQQLVVNLQTITQLAAARPIGTGEDVRVVEDLDLPDPEVVTQQVNAKNRAAANPAARGAAVANELIVNPFIGVFEAIETLRQYAGGPASRSPDEHASAVALVSAMSDWQAAVLGSLTASNAVLRRLWRALRPGSGNAATAPALLTRVGQALGLQHDQNGTWHDPTYYFISDQEAAPSNPTAPRPVGPTVVPLELRVVPTHRSMLGTTVLVIEGHEHTMVLGRDIGLGVKDKYKGFEGVSHNGSTKPMDWLIPGIGGRDPVRAAQRLKVVLHISAAEGAFDAVRSRDRGLLSIGIQQWTAHVNTGLSTMLHRFRQTTPDHFDLLFGLYGLQTVLSANDGNGVEVTDPEGIHRQRAVDMNPDWRPGTPGPILELGGPDLASFRAVKPGVEVNTDARLMLPEKSTARKEYFGATTVGQRTIMANDWSARGRLAGRYSKDFQRNQLELATLRFDRVRSQNTARIPGTTVDKTVAELFCSEFGAAVLLDTHVNAPSNIMKSITAALKRTKGRNALDANGIHGLSKAWLVRFVDNFFQVRVIDAGIKRGRDEKIRPKRDNPLETDPGSFTAW